MSEENLSASDEIEAEEMSAAQTVFGKYSNRFGPVAATKYLSKGLSYPQAMEAHIGVLNRRLLKSKQQVTALTEELADTRTQMKLLATGERTPLKGSYSQHSGGRPANLADVVALANANAPKA